MDAIQKQLTDFLNILTRGQPFGWNNVLDVLIVAVFAAWPTRSASHSFPVGPAKAGIQR